ncbi:hypothetical protein BN59_02478 [Legionella massiliensis]|uniref:Uncharacterized protein n=1 Tax=Legionella massiliensis TaxID=1034943 RepID=A0A078KUN3_9GAMM|nr:hypothetical protein [Legionella massiliensis]CDZ78170.1 hypothetical protein BN59_02478 [Legionella massiliensis]CEE13908.1 hypothetical protein BN1094_02478 [Legionella massiliensis]
MGADSAKTLLGKYNQKKYRQFTLNDDEELSLPAISSVPGIGFSDRKDVYKKITLPQSAENHVRFITKNDEPYSFLWQTNPGKLKTAVRWGIVRTESITAKVISALGKYRVTAYERIAKGMVSNTQDLKLKLLDLYQDRFEALQELERLVNKQNSAEDYAAAIKRYTEKLNLIASELDSQFLPTSIPLLHSNLIDQVKKDIVQDIKRAEDYLQFIKTKKSLRSVNRSAGIDSVLEFIKEQMSYNLYELQGINQDLTYSSKRRFALTRGEFNDFIEDARKEVDDYQADPRNAQTINHQGLYETEEHSQVSYDFSMDNLTPARERQALLAISFIEGWDKLKNPHGKTPYVQNESGTEILKVIAATNWRSHRNFIAFMKSMGYFLLNMLKSFFVATHPWYEEAWSNKDFHLVAMSLAEHAKPNEPLWYKPLRFLRTLGHAVLDLFKGVRDFGSELVFEMPLEVYGDYIASTAMQPTHSVLEQAENDLSFIKELEADRLKTLLGSLNGEVITSKPTATLAQSEYHLTAGETNDIITSVVRGLNGFSSIFTHGLYAKDPVAGLAFTATYLVGGAAIFFPSASAALWGSAYVNWFNTFSYSMGSSKLAAAIAGGSTQAQLVASSWDLLMRGPNSSTASFAMQVLEDPLTTGTYFAAAYGLGHVLVNGINGHPIPWLSEVLRNDMGTQPELNYPLLGGKIGFIVYESFESHNAHPYHQKKLRYNGEEIVELPIQFNDNYKKIIDRFCMVLWLSKYAADLPKLKSSRLFKIARQIDSLFPPAEASSLKKILYPEKEHSIAYQLFSIPLSYIPAIFRVVVSPLISLYALFNKNPYPLKPMTEAGDALGKKIIRDLSRLAVATSDAVHLFYNILASQIKALVFTVNMLVGRLAGIFNWHPGHAMHQVFASVHVFFDQIGAFFYPARLIKNTISAHPIHTFNESEQSYHKLLSEFEFGEKSLPLTAKKVDNFPSPLQAKVEGHEPLESILDIEFSEQAVVVT